MTDKRFGSRQVVLAAGGYITKPRGEMHTMWNAGPVPARMIVLISPAVYQNDGGGALSSATTSPIVKSAQARRDDPAICA